VNRASASPLPPLAIRVCICLVLAVATFAVYLPVRSFDFVNYDDPVYFSANPHVLGGLNWTNIKWTFTTGETGNWHPLTWLSLMLDAQLFGRGPAAPHLTNVLLHLANSILLFLLLQRLTGALRRSAIVALFFAIHPLHVESVAWISERKDVLSSFFGLLTLLFYARYADCKNRQPIPSSGSPRTTCHSSLVFALLFFTCGLMSKSMLVTLPFVMLLLDFWPLQRFATMPWSRLLVEKIPFFFLGVADSVLTFIVQQKAGAVTTLVWIPLSVRIENAFVSCARYLARIFWPVNLAAPYPHPIQWPAPLIIFSIALVATLCVAAVALRNFFPFLLMGWYWFAGMLVPVIGLVQVGMPAMADRYTYLPIIGILIIAVWGVAEIYAKSQLPVRTVYICTAVLFLVCALRARNQVSVWQNDETLFGHALAVTDNNYIACLDLALWYSRNGRVQEALDAYDQAMQMGSNDLAVAWYSQNNRVQNALYYYYNTYRVNLKDPTQLYNLANAAAKIGHWDDAIRDYRLALQITPNQPDILNNLGLALAQNRQLTQAAACFEATLKLQPDSVDAHNNLATILFAQTNFAGAAQHFEAALQLSPGDPRICANIGGTYLRLGQTNLAIKFYQQALHLQPDNAAVRAQLQSLGFPPAN
jgi:protein O-mannosyl-transferase